MIDEFVKPGHYYSVIPSVDDNFNDNSIKFKNLEFNDKNHAQILNKMKGILVNFDKNFGIKINSNNKKIDICELQTYISSRYEKFQFSLGNSQFGWMDARLLYYYLKVNKPKRIIEIGSGNSTLLMYNTKKQLNLDLSIICIEPFPNDYLIKLSNLNEITLIKDKLENVDLNKFKNLVKNDILFIDSSHVLKLNSDVLYYFTRILPILRRGVYVHIHDIFFPYDYPSEWIRGGKFWNEQYFLFIFLQYNTKYKITFCNKYAEYKYSDKLKVIQKDCYENLTFIGNSNKNVFSGGSIWLKVVG
jgi:predicted O-methyltransferase YrrM